MKVIYFSLFIILLSTGTLKAQYNPEECGTVDTGVDFLQTIPRQMQRRLAGTKIMKMYIVLYADDDGSNLSMSEEDVRNEVNFCNSIFNIGDICFTLVGIEIRKSTNFNNPIYETTSYNSEKVSGAFTVFVVKSIDGKTGNSGTLGWAPNTPASYMITRTAGFGTRRTFIHEMGHALGLHHTFKGTGHNVDNPGCDELVNGSNGTTCGDLVADTPADPYQLCGTSISGCTFPYVAPDCKDANGSSFNPQMNNLMSYWANYGCNRTQFTTGQYEKMRNTIDNNTTLTSFLAPDTKSLYNQQISSGFIKEAAKNSIYAGNVAALGNYIISLSANATISAKAVILVPGFTAKPNSTGVVRIISSSCQ